MQNGDQAKPNHRFAYLCLDNVYLRNKETQQTLRVIVSIQYDASF